jgi:hypothetical protein
VKASLSEGFSTKLNMFGLWEDELNISDPLRLEAVHATVYVASRVSPTRTTHFGSIGDPGGRIPGVECLPQ